MAFFDPSRWLNRLKRYRLRSARIELHHSTSPEFRRKWQIWVRRIAPDREDRRMKIGMQIFYLKAHLRSREGWDVIFLNPADPLVSMPWFPDGTIFIFERKARWRWFGPSEIALMLVDIQLGKP